MAQFKLHHLLEEQVQATESNSISSEINVALLNKISETYLNFERKEKELKQSLEILRKNQRHTNLKLENLARNANHAINNITEVVFELDLTGNYIYLNQAWETLTGLKVIDCLGEHYSKNLKGLRPKDNLELNQLIGQNFKSFCRVLEFKNINGDVLWLDVSVKKMFSIKDEPIGYVGTISDITSQKEKELTLVEEKDKQILANKAKDEFLSTISHEIRTPLNAVIGISHLLLIEDPKGSQLKHLNILKSSSEHLLSLVNDVLDFGKIESGNIEIESVEFDLSNSINGILASYANIAEEKDINFSINIDSKIPKKIEGDPTRLSQILTNLLSNAIKFTNSGSVALNIKCMQKTAKYAHLYFEVIDTGIGITKKQQDMIFNAFTQADTSTARKFGGTGLGLSISKKLVQLMGSDISLKSELGIGSVFSFPLRFKLNTSEQLTVLNDSLPEAKNSLDGISVLVAEDNKVNCLIIKRFLSKWGVQLEIASDGIEAVEKFKKGNFDLVFMDIMMPNMNGFEATKIIREFDTQTPIIALTAAIGNNIEKEYGEAGMNGHISKPFNPNTLFSLLKRKHASLAKKANI